MHRRVAWATMRARSAVTLARLKAWDESQHPREPAGTSEGGRFAGGEGGDTPAAAASKPKGKKVTSTADFTKDDVVIDADTRSKPDKQKKFIDTWNEHIGEAPAEFKKDFLGGVPASMGITFHDDQNIFTVSGSFKNERGDNVGEYTRDIYLADKKAVSSYFRLFHGRTGKDVGKKVLAANVAMYKQMGLNRVDVHANIDVGGYAWAKYGYVPNWAAWDSLRSDLDDKINRMSSGSGGGGGYRADSWEELSDAQQRHIEQEFYNQTREEFLSSEVDNWRDSGNALDDAKVELADNFGQGSAWAIDAIDAYRDERKENGKADIPFDNRQLIEAMLVDYEAGYEGRGDFNVTFVDDKLREPKGGHDPNQPTLPGIEEIKPHERLTEDMREGIERSLSKAFDNEADDRQSDMEPPDYLAENIRDFQKDVWENYSERDRYKWAEHNAEDMLGSDDGESSGTGEISDEDADRLRKLTASEDGKAIWAIADSPWGKELLLGTDWNGSLDLKDKETMDRFNAYVAKGKKESKSWL